MYLQKSVVVEWCVVYIDFVWRMNIRLSNVWVDSIAAFVLTKSKVKNGIKQQFIINSKQSVSAFRKSKNNVGTKKYNNCQVR